MNPPLIATSDPEFRNKATEWLSANSELLVAIRYPYAAGSKDFEFYSSIDQLVQKTSTLPPRTNVILFRSKHLPLRGVVDDEFIARSLQSIPDDAEYLVVELQLRVYGKQSWFHHESGISHRELRQTLEDSRGIPVAAGVLPPWHDTTETFDAYIPDSDGQVRPAAY
jgi:hypothetical protein